MAIREGHDGIASRLLDAVVRGELLDLAGEGPVDESVVRGWDESRAVQASLIRDILRGRLAPTPDPRGLRLRGAHILGRLDLDNLQTSVPLTLIDCLLSEGLVARDACLSSLTLDGCVLEHPDEPPLDADGLRSTAFLGLVGTVVAGDTAAGAVRLLGARIDGQLTCAGTTIRNASGPALIADDLEVRQAVLLTDGFEAVGGIRLHSARIGGQLNCRGAKIRSTSGPALDAEHLQVDRSVFLCDGFDATGTGELGAVRLLDAHIGGQLTIRDAKIHNYSGPALLADRLQVDQSIFFLNGFDAVGAGPNATVRLLGARIGGSFRFTPDGVTNESHPQARLLLDGMTYSGIPDGMTVDAWLAFLRDGTPAYAAQPYQQLASACRAAGNERDTRRILMEQRRHQLHSGALTGRGERAWARLTRLTLGYGYQPWRALIGLLAVLLVAILLCILANSAALAHTQDSPTPLAACSTVERIGVGVDLGLPLVKAGSRAGCDLTATPAGQQLTVAGWILQVLSWAFATLFVAGFTSAVRKP